MMKSRLEIKNGIELAPMVDIVFLLVTYFLINATLARNPAIKIELPKSQTAQSELQRHIVIQVSASGALFINGESTDLPSLPAKLDQLVKDKENDQVIIKGDKEADYQSIVSVMDSVHQSGISHFNLATER